MCVLGQQESLPKEGNSPKSDFPWTEKNQNEWTPQTMVSLVRRDPPSQDM